MKRMLNVMAILAMIIAVGFVMVACEVEGSGDDGIFNKATGDSILVSNYTKTNLIAYKGSVSPQTCLGGIKNGNTNHPLLYTNQLNAKPEQFKMIFITEEAYGKGNVSASTPVFTQTFVFWNGNVGDNSKVYEISGRLGGDFTLQIWNPSNFDVEFRVDGTAGPTLGYAQRGMAKTNLYVGAGDYQVFPVFQRINTLRDIVETVYPTYTGGANVVFGFNFGDDPTQKMLSLNLHEALEGVASQSLGAASVIVVNSGSTGITFYKGNTPMLTPTGAQVINAGAQREFIIDMPKSSGGYGDKITISNFSVQIGAGPAYVTVEGSDPVSRDAVLLSDKMYTITVKGGGNSGPLTATINTEAPKDFKLEAGQGFEDKIVLTGE